MTSSIALLKASDGTGNASIATVQNTRSALATTIQVDTVDGIPATFMGSMGTPHTFTDPVTNEQITVISEATAVDFAGHVDGSNLEIDTIAPGYTDAGSAVGDIVVIRPTTQYADNLAAVLGVEHNDDGTHHNITADSLSTDTISEKTSGNGVSIDSFHVKDGEIVNPDGWNTPNETWTYVSATTFKITGVDVRSKYPVGTKIKLTQTTVKYFYVVSSSFSSDTTITVSAGSDYSLANAAITSNFYSYATNPQGFPKKFAWTPTVSGAWSSTTVAQFYFTMNGADVKLHIYITGTSNAASTSVPLPIPPSTDLTYYEGQSGLVIDNGAVTGPGRWSIDNSSGQATNVGFFTNQSGSNFTGSGTKAIRAVILYSAAG